MSNSNAINIVTGAYQGTGSLAFVPEGAIDPEVLSNAEYESDEGNESPLIELGLAHGFSLDPFAPLFFSSVDHPKYGTINDVFSSEESALDALEGLLDEGEDYDPEVGIMQHLIDEHGCVIYLESFSDPRLQRLSQTGGLAGAPVQKMDALDAVTSALALLENAQTTGLDADVLNDLRKAISNLNHVEQALTPQD